MVGVQGTILRRRAMHHSSHSKPQPNPKSWGKEALTYQILIARLLLLFLGTYNASSAINFAKSRPCLIMCVRFPNTNDPLSSADRPCQEWVGYWFISRTVGISTDIKWYQYCQEIWKSHANHMHIFFLNAGFRKPVITKILPTYIQINNWDICRLSFEICLCLHLHKTSYLFQKASICL